jgi:hypothetical protein
MTNVGHTPTIDAGQQPKKEKSFKQHYDHGGSLQLHIFFFLL